ncbi:MAG: response regulator, partial [Nitrospirae bacterium]
MKGNQPTVLIVDDEQLYCDLLGAILSRSGYEVRTALNGLDGIKLFKQWRPRFTLLDLRLPDIHGIEVLREIKKIDPQAAVMVLTNWGTDFMENQARQLGVRDFFSKKMTLDTLMAALENTQKQMTSALTLEVPLAAGAKVGNMPQSAEAVGPPDAVGAAETTVASESGGEKSILIVDDEPQVLDVLSQFFTQRSYRVRVASGGAEALSLIAQESPSLLILDIYMPGINGIGVLRQ